MTYVCIFPFVGALDGAEVQFLIGDVIGEGDALELGLANKPDIAEPEE